jgi:SOS-response transcriptional repressor LexA
MHIGQRIKELMEVKKISGKEMAIHCGITPGAVSSWFSTGRISKEKLAMAAELLGVSTDKLISGEANQKLGNVDAARAFTGEVPVISWVQAGNWNEASDPFQPGDAERFLPIFRGHSSSTYALKVRGDSMTSPHGKSYPQGSYIIVDPAKLSPNNGDRIIAKLEGSDEVTFKVYKAEDGRKWLAPLNNSHLPITEPFKVLGTVIGKWEDE